MRARRSGFVALALGAWLGLSGCVPGFGTGHGQGNTDWRTGSCHRLTDAIDLSLDVVSETSPSVTCSEEHSTETFGTRSVPARIARYRERPSPFLMAGAIRPLCGKDDLAAFMGAGDGEQLYGVQPFAFGPSRLEWNRGVRSVRCDAVLATDPGQPLAEPTLSTSLKGILTTGYGARFRLCRVTDHAGRHTRTGCDQPHSAESAGTAAPAPDGRTAQERCDRLAARYVGGPLPDRLVVRAEPAAAELGCWIGPAEPDTLRTGSLHASGHRTKTGRTT
ncbi:MAG TPA: septum formation family protein [Streptomyces sp.]